MLRTILVPLDGSDFAEQALPLAAAIALEARARLELVTVFKPPVPVPGGQGALVHDLRFDQELRRGQRLALDEAVRRVDAMHSELTVTGEQLEGDIVHLLNRRIREVGADLVVMTSHGRGGLERAWLGSVTDALVRHAEVPVLVVRVAEGAAPPTRIRRVLVALDGPESETVLDAAREVAAGPDVAWRLVRVVVPLADMLRNLTPEAYDRDMEEQRSAAQRQLDEQAARLRALGLTVDAVLEERPQPARAILAQAEAWGADLIALATHGRGGAARLLMGSVADKVLRGATVPVLLSHREAAPDIPDAA